MAFSAPLRDWVGRVKASTSQNEGAKGDTFIFNFPFPQGLWNVERIVWINYTACWLSTHLVEKL